MKVKVGGNTIDALVALKTINANTTDKELEVDNNNLKVVKGDKGTIFTPYIDNNSNLSWSNNDGLPNPPTVNIKGDKGEKGDKGDVGSVTALTNLEIEAILGGI